MKYLSLLLLICIYFDVIGNTNTDKGSPHFPKHWDTGGVLATKNILLWVQYNDTLEHRWHRACITLETKKDNMGNEAYELCKYIYGSDTNWQQSWEIDFTWDIIHVPNRFSSQLKFINFQKTFNHRPDTSDVYSCLHDWDFSILESGYLSSKIGIDDDLCMQVLGWKINREAIAFSQKTIETIVLQSYCGEIKLK